MALSPLRNEKQEKVCMSTQAIEFTRLEVILNFLTVRTDPAIGPPCLFQCGVKQVNLNCF